MNGKSFQEPNERLDEHHEEYVPSVKAGYHWFKIAGSSHKRKWS